MDDLLRWERYLFSSHSQTELVSWARSLEFFRFCRAYGGHANDGDRLLVAVRIESELDLVAVFDQLGIGVQRLPEDNPRPLPGVQYSAAEFGKFVSRIQQFPSIGQPGAVRLAGAAVWGWVHAGRLDLEIRDADNPYDVSAAAITSARLVEPLLLPLSLSGKLIDPPQDDQHCICPKFYPEFWNSP